MSDEPKPAGHVDWLDFRFSGLEENELFWLTNSSNESQPFRKLNLNEGINIKSQQVQSFSKNLTVYQRT